MSGASLWTFRKIVNGGVIYVSFFKTVKNVANIIISIRLAREVVSLKIYILFNKISTFIYKRFET